MSQNGCHRSEGFRTRLRALSSVHVQSTFARLPGDRGHRACAGDRAATSAATSRSRAPTWSSSAPSGSLRRWLRCRWALLMAVAAARVFIAAAVALAVPAAVRAAVAVSGLLAPNVRVSVSNAVRSGVTHVVSVSSADISTLKSAACSWVDVDVRIRDDVADGEVRRDDAPRTVFRVLDRCIPGMQALEARDDVYQARALRGISARACSSAPCLALADRWARPAEGSRSPWCASPTEHVPAEDLLLPTDGRGAGRVGAKAHRGESSRRQEPSLAKMVPLRCMPSKPTR